MNTIIHTHTHTHTYTHTHTHTIHSLSLTHSLTHSLTRIHYTHACTQTHTRTIHTHSLAYTTHMHARTHVRTQCNYKQENIVNSEITRSQSSYLSDIHHFHKIVVAHEPVTVRVSGFDHSLDLVILEVLPQDFEDAF